MPQAWILCTIFAMLSPLGIGTGIALIEAGGSSPQTVAIFMAITTGICPTFLFLFCCPLVTTNPRPTGSH
jgi:hypothetical protein